jgi:hypothetical protein
MFEPPLPRANKTLKLRQLVAQMLAARAGNRVRLAAIHWVSWANPAALFQARDRAVKGSRAEPDSCEALNVLHHGVAVLIAVGKA